MEFRIPGVICSTFIARPVQKGQSDGSVTIFFIDGFPTGPSIVAPVEKIGEVVQDYLDNVQIGENQEEQ